MGGLGFVSKNISTRILDSTWFFALLVSVWSFCLLRIISKWFCARKISECAYLVNRYITSVENAYIGVGFITGIQRISSSSDVFDRFFHVYPMVGFFLDYLS